MNTVTNPHTLSELRRQRAFHNTMYKQHEAKHQAAQAAKLAKIEQLNKAIAAAEELQNMETN